MNNKLISVHGLLRYLERTGRLEAIEKEMLSGGVAEAISNGATSVKRNGLTFVIADGRIITVLDNTRPRWTGKRKKTKQPHFVEATP